MQTTIQRRAEPNTDEVDVLVVGSGNAGMTAALTARISGVQKVLLIDKDKVYGGTSAMSGGGVWVPCNRYAVKAGAKDSLDEAFQYLRQTIPEQETSDEMLMCYLKLAPEMVDFLHDNTDVRYQSLESYPDYFSDASGAKPGHRSMEPLPISTNKLGEFFQNQITPNPMIKVFDRLHFTQRELYYLMGRHPGWISIVLKELCRYAIDLPMRIRGRQSRRLTMGAAGVARLRLSMHKRDIPVCLNTKLVELLSENGRVVGAKVERDGRMDTILVNKGVILTAGGFEQNQSLRDQFLPEPTSTRWSSGSRANTGDALLAAVDVGAAKRLMSHAWWTTTISVPGEAYPRLSIFEKSLPGNYVVDSRGVRIANESQNYMTFMRALHEERSKGGARPPYYMIFDARHRESYIVGPLLPRKIWPDALIPKRYCQDGFLSRASSIEDLASQIGVDRECLLETVDKVNGYAKTGQDLEFHRGESLYDRYYSDPAVKPNPCLAPLDQPPFYAMRIDPGDFGTQGGLVTDKNARVLREDGSPIPGLYAAGNCAAGILTTYPGPGATLGPAMAFAYQAARQLAALADTEV